MFVVANSAGWIKMPLGMEVGLGPGDLICVRWGPSSPPAQKGAQPFQFLPCLGYCGLTAGCIRIPLGTRVGLGPGDCVRLGPSSLLKGVQPQNYRPMSIVAKPGEKVG